MRQSTTIRITLYTQVLSKLPMRQSTKGNVLELYEMFSKLPIRQSTEFMEITGEEFDF